MAKKLMLLMVVFSMLSITSIGLAQNRENSITLSPFFGFYKFDDDQHIDDSIYFGLRGGYNFTKYLGSEIFLGYAPSETEINIDKQDLEYADSEFLKHYSDNKHVNVYRYGLEVLFHFIPDYKFDPFIAAGYGGCSIDYSGDTDHFGDYEDFKDFGDHNFGMFNYGLGLNCYITENLAIRGDIRQDLFRDSGHSLNNMEFTAGMTYQFGGNEKPMVSYTPQPEAPPPPRKVEPTVESTPAPKPEIVLIELDDIHFKHDKSELTDAGKEIVNKNIQTLKDNPDIKILIAGYCSASGTDEYNQKLSERRATTVRQYLINEGGIAPERLTKIGYGEKRPAEFEALPKDIESEAAKANRRVLFTIIVG
jgi:OmpA-OmpF porin, OOP family